MGRLGYATEWIQAAKVSSLLALFGREAELSVRSRNVLESLGPKATVGDLLAMGRAGLTGMRGAGKTTVYEIDRAVRFNGLEWGALFHPVPHGWSRSDDPEAGQVAPLPGERE